MKKQKITQLETSEEGIITSVTFNTIEFKKAWSKEMKKAYKKLTETTRTSYYLVDKDGFYTLLNENND